jgi:hypothetical protein
MSESRRPRFAAAIAIAPLAAPVAVYVGLVARAWLAGTMAEGLGQGPAVQRAVATVLWLFIVVMFGAPLAYAATLVILWPSACILVNGERNAWPALVLIATLAGGAALPVYTKMLEPRGHIGLFPGAGFVAGAATGLAFWRIATRA